MGGRGCHSRCPLACSLHQRGGLDRGRGGLVMLRAAHPPVAVPQRAAAQAPQLRPLHPLAQQGERYNPPTRPSFILPGGAGLLSQGQGGEGRQSGVSVGWSNSWERGQGGGASGRQRCDGQWAQGSDWGVAPSGRGAGGVASTDSTFTLGQMCPEIHTPATSRILRFRVLLVSSLASPDFPLY